MMLFISILTARARRSCRHPAGERTRLLWFISPGSDPSPGSFASSPRAGSLFPARGHCLAEQLSEQGVGTALRQCEHMQISQRDAYPKVLMNL